MVFCAVKVQVYLSERRRLFSIRDFFNSGFLMSERMCCLSFSLSVGSKVRVSFS